MGVRYQKAVGTMLLGVIVLLLAGSCAIGAEQAQAEQKSSEQLLLQIVDLHSRLVTNDVFLAQAKMLGAYLESAQPMEESKKAAIYRSVLGMLERIKESSVRAATEPQEKAKPEPKSPGIQPDKAKTTYKPGLALLEVFKGNSLNQVSDFPPVRTYWKQGLTCSGFPVPERYEEVGDRWVAKFSFYYQAEQSGKYGFSLHGASGQFILRMGGEDIVKSSGQGEVELGTCNLDKGFHRVEFWVIGNGRGGEPGGYGGARRGSFFGGGYYGTGFEVKVLTPDAWNPAPLTSNMMLLPADQVKAPQAGQRKGASGQAVPYVDY